MSLSFDLRADGATVRAVIGAVASGAAAPMRLHGSPEVSLLSITLDGAPLAEGVGYTHSPDGGLVVEQAALPAAGTKFTLATEVALKPADNTSLEGLYNSSGNFCTQARGTQMRACARVAAARARGASGGRIRQGDGCWRHDTSVCACHSCAPDTRFALPRRSARRSRSARSRSSRTARTC